MESYALAALLLCSVLPAQGNLLLQPCGGGVGKPITYKVSGGISGQTLVFLTGLSRGTFPLSIIDPRDKRALGLNPLFDLAIYVGFDTKGEFGFTTTVPNTVSLAGFAVLHQAVSYPGTTTTFDKLSEMTVVSVEPADKWLLGAKSMAWIRAFSSLIELGDGRVMIVGGGGGWLMWQGARSTTEVFDPVTKSFSSGPSMTAARSSHTQTRLKDGRYLITGGVGNPPLYSVNSSCEIFDPSTGKFTAVRSMSAKRTMHTAALLPNGKVIVMGGNSDVSSNQNWATTQQSSTEIYDPAINTWRRGPSMRRSRSGHAMQDLGNGQYLIMGGITRSFTSTVILTDCEVYNASTNSSSSVGRMATNRAFPATFRLPNGKVLVAGGMSGVINQSGATGTATNLCEIYNPSTKTWSTAAPLTTPTAGAATVAMRDGRFAVLGGGSNSLSLPNPTTQAMAYDPSTSKWVGLPSMVTGRISSMAIALQSCQIAVFGGGATNAGKSIATWEMLVK